MDDACQGKNGTLKETWSNCQCNFIYKTTKSNVIKSTNEHFKNV